MKTRVRKASLLLLSLGVAGALAISSANCCEAAAKKPSKIYVKAKNTSIYVGATTKVYVSKVKPAKASKAVTFKSSNKSIATVSAKGIVTGKKAGKVTITVTSKKAKKVKAKVTITVRNKPVKPVVDLENKTVSIQATVNSKYLNPGSDGKLPAVWHFVTSSCDTESQKGNALFDTKSKAMDLYAGLEKIGGKPWATSNKQFAAGKKFEDADIKAMGNADFSYLTMTFYDGDTLVGTADELVKYEQNNVLQTVAPIKMCFSGNKVNQTNWNSGCVTCIFSCFSGVVSNAKIGFSMEPSVKKDYFYADTTKLEAGKTYTIVYSLGVKECCDTDD